MVGPQNFGVDLIVCGGRAFGCWSDITFTTTNEITIDKHFQGWPLLNHILEAQIFQNVDIESVTCPRTFL